MPYKRIYILTGPIQSGKTTKLTQWSAERKDVFGILTPVIGGNRFFMNAHTGEQFEMEAGLEEENTFNIGKFTFSRKAFEKAIDILNQSMKEKNGWLIIDEIGPLELREEGFNTIIKNILATDTNLNILFVIRDTILDEALKFYELNIKGVTVINKDADLLSPL